MSDEISCSSGKLSFKWDVGSCSSSSSVAYSPLSLMSAPAKASSEQTLLTPLRKDYCMSRLSSMSQQSMLYGVVGSPKSMKNMEGEEEEEEEEACNCRTAQWITTDSDCELCLHCLFFFVYIAELFMHVLCVGTSSPASPLACSCGVGAVS